MGAKAETTQKVNIMLISLDVVVPCQINKQKLLYVFFSLLRLGPQPCQRERENIQLNIQYICMLYGGQGWLSHSEIDVMHIWTDGREYVISRGHGSDLTCDYTTDSTCDLISMSWNSFFWSEGRADRPLLCVQFSFSLTVRVNWLNTRAELSLAGLGLDRDTSVTLIGLTFPGGD